MKFKSQLILFSQSKILNANNIFRESSIEQYDLEEKTERKATEHLNNISLVNWIYINALCFDLYDIESRYVLSVSSYTDDALNIASNLDNIESIISIDTLNNQRLLSRISKDLSALYDTRNNLNKALIGVEDAPIDLSYLDSKRDPELQKILIKAEYDVINGIERLDYLAKCAFEYFNQKFNSKY